MVGEKEDLRWFNSLPDAFEEAFSESRGHFLFPRK